MKRFSLYLLAVASVCVMPMSAYPLGEEFSSGGEIVESDSGRAVTAFLKDKRVIRGTLLNESESSIRILTESGTTYQLPRSQIRSMEISPRSEEPVQRSIAQPIERVQELPADTLATIQLSDNTTIVGTILSWEQDSVRVKTSYGVMIIPRAKISSIKMSSAGAASPTMVDTTGMVGRSAFLYLKGGGTVRGTIAKFTKNRVTITMEDSRSITYDLSDIEKIERDSGTLPPDVQPRSIVTTSGMADGREGFIIGLGLGAGRTNTKLKYSYPTFTGYPNFTYTMVERENSISNTGLITDFKIGHAPSDHLAIFWTSKVSWLLGNDPILISGIGNVAAAYYFQPQSPSPFVSAGLGYTSYGGFLSTSKSVESQYGFGFFLGGGYEFARHWDVECDLIFGSPAENFSTFTIKITLNFLSY